MSTPVFRSRRKKKVEPAAVSAGTLPRAPVPLPREGMPPMSPRARRRARLLNMPMQAFDLPPEGRRITERDVLAAAETLARLDDAAKSRLASAEPRWPGQRVPLSSLRRSISEHMAYAQSVIPQFSVNVLVRAGPVLEMRRRLAKSWGRKAVPAIDDFYLRALAILLAQETFKSFRGLIDGNDVVYRGAIHLGFAVSIKESTQGGVIVPVLQCVDRLNLKELSEKSRELATHARHRKLKTEEYSGALMTISNLGDSGVYSFREIVRPGESAILAIPAAHPRQIYAAMEKKGRGAAAVKDVTTEPCWELSMSVDHRLVDGALAADFLARLKGLVEDPERL